MTKATYLEAKKVYIELKILAEKAKGWDNTTLEDLNKISDAEKVLEEHWQKVEEKYKLEF